MMAVFVSLLLLPFAGLPQSADDSTETRRLLERVATELHGAHLLSYEADYRKVDPAQEDSVFEMSSTVWVERVPGDSLFGARFHVRGQRHDREKRYDYYYDGLYSYEWWQGKDTLTVIHAHKDFARQGPIHPAKARVALLPFVGLFVEDNLVGSLFEENPTASLKRGGREQRIVTLQYPENGYGQVVTKTLHIASSTPTITKIVKQVEWRGVTSRTTIKIDDYRTDQPGIADSISIGDRFEGYATKSITPEKDPEQSRRSNLIGSEAPSFAYPTYEGGKLSLSELKGKVVVLDFWESWCGWCLVTFPELKNLQKRYRNEGVVVVGITTENREPVERLIESNALNYTNIFADEDILEDYDISGRPKYVLIDRKGTVIEAKTGNLGAIKSKLQDMLK